MSYGSTLEPAHEMEALAIPTDRRELLRLGQDIVEKGKSLASAAP